MSALDAFRSAYVLPTMVCDMDDTLDFEAIALVAAANITFGLDLDYATLTDYHPLDLGKHKQNKWVKQWRQLPEVYLNLAPDWHCIDALTALKTCGHSIVISSDRIPELHAVSLQWLARWNVPFDQVAINGPQSKPTLAQQSSADNPMILIDDDMRKDVLASPTFQVWHPRRPWTPADAGSTPNTWVFDKWDQVLAKLDVDRGPILS